MPAKRIAVADRVLAIDPSTTKAGVAWGRHIRPFVPAHLMGCGVFVTDDKDHFTTKVHDLTNYVDKLHEVTKFSDCVIEMPETWASPKGVRASTSGSMMMLGMAVGELRRWAICRGVRAHLVRVSTWKGQLSKELMFRRLRARGFHQVHDRAGYDEADAVSLLDWWIRDNDPSKVSPVSFR